MEVLKLKGSAELINEKAKFKCSVEGKEDITVDYIPPLGDGEGHTSLELLLLSLSSCFATSVKFMLMKEKIKVEGLRVKAEGERREVHPTAFKNISLFIFVKAKGLRPDILENVIRMSEESICPVYSMIKDSSKIDVKYKIENTESKMSAETLYPDKKTASYCGVFCPACVLYIGTKEEPGRLIDLSERMGRPVEELKCSGCRSDEQSFFCKDCVFKICAEESSYESCAECPDYPCSILEKFQTEMPQRADLWKSLEDLKTEGFEKWSENQASDFACPKCSVINSAYDLSCRNCSSVPGSSFADRHRNKITAHLMNK